LPAKVNADTANSVAIIASFCFDFKLTYRYLIW
jgi:hypothetical protein